jgi:CRP-like cAMP-binding protein
MAALTGFGAKALWPAGFLLYERGAPASGIFVVLRGRIVLRTRVKSGRGFVPSVATVGMTFGGEGLVGLNRVSAVYATDARADEESETLYVSAERFRSLLRERPSEALALVSQVMDEHASLFDRLRELATFSVERRLIAALVRMGHQGVFVRPGERLVVDAAQYRLLCELVGATRESVSLVVNRLVGSGLAERRAGGGIVVSSPADLLEHASIPASPGVVGGPLVADLGDSVTL